MNDALRALVWRRAENRCEYCRMPQPFDPLPFGVDHIRPHYHHGPTTADNLCLCCFHCNTFKSVNIAGYDPETNQIAKLFDPRHDVWSEHFELRDGRITGNSAIGRTTADVLRFNLPERVEHRCLLGELGAFEP
ncbi:MAG TPA: HNH endonuclease signature motif containing protein [Pirellulales bacterium]